MNKEEHQAFLQSLKESQERSRLVKIMERISQTLTGVRGTIEDIQQTNKKIDKVQNQFSLVMDKLAMKFASSFSNPLKRLGENDERQKPTKISMDKAVEAMMDHKEILFVTGAGVSADSGIPTFRGLNGLYTKNFVVDGEQIEPQKFITKQFFSSKPQAIWDWVDQFHKISSQCKPNRIHSLIHECLLSLSRKGKKPTLVTQNIDNLHIKPKNNEYQLHPIHGDLSLIRCCNLHYFPYKKQKTTLPCPQCGQKIRPHVMFFDESYGIPFGKDVKDRQFDFVVVIGSSLSTGLCIKLVSSALQVIQINPGPVIEVGNVHPFENTQKALQQMLKSINDFECI